VPQSRFGRRGEEKILDPTRTRSPTPLFNPWPVAIPTALSPAPVRRGKVGRSDIRNQNKPAPHNSYQLLKDIFEEPEQCP
jgi:hypothetical protein